MRALIVEDEFLSREILRKFLEPLAEVDIVVNGEEAIQAFRYAHAENNPYDVVMLDIMMPVVNGLEALKKIRAIEKERDYPAVKVIMTTALNDPRTVIDAFHDGGASGYIVKPVDKAKLYAEFKKVGLLES